MAELPLILAVDEDAEALAADHGASSSATRATTA